MAIGPVSVLGAVLIGIAILWTVRLSYSLNPSNSDDALRLVLTLAGWILIHIGLLSIVAQVFYSPPGGPRSAGSWLSGMAVGCFLTVPIVLIVFGMAAARFRTLESASLMWLLSAAGERRVPLLNMVRSFALERTDEVGLRAARLADLLESGVLLPEALEQSRLRLPLEGIFAARFGTESGNLSEAVRSICGGTEDVDRLVRSSIEKFCYLGIILWIAVAQVSFMYVKVLPIIDRMFLEFEMPMPILTTRVMQVGDSLQVIVPLMLIPAIPLSLGLAVLGVLYYLDWIPRDLPLLGWLTRRYDSALIMKALAMGVGQRMPLSKTIWILARLYPRRSVRRRLVRAGRRVNDGEDWCGSLRRQNLIRHSDAAVFEAAQRVGNLEWALVEMSEASLRRLSYRLLVWINVVFPISLLLIGLVIAVAVTAYFMPLVQMMDLLS